MPQELRPGNGTIVGWRPRGAAWAWTLAGTSFVACSSDGTDPATRHASETTSSTQSSSVTATNSSAPTTTVTTGEPSTGTLTSTSAVGATASSGTEAGSGGTTTLSTGSTSVGGSGGIAGSGGELVVPPEGSYDFGSMPTSVSSRDASLAYRTFKQSYVEACGDGLYRVRWDDPALTVSEGIAYGMLLAVSNDDREVFDGLLQYYENNLDANGLMHWRREGCQGANPGDNSDNAATDADLDVAMALIMAECRWGDAAYGERADAVTSALLQHGTSSADGVNLLHPGDVFGGTDCLNASYFAPAYYRVFAERAASEADAAFWTQLAVDSYLLLDRMAHATTGFVPNWSDDQGATTESGPPGCAWYTDAHIFGSDAIRTPWRIAVDYLWWGTPEAKQWLDTVTLAVKPMGITSIGRKFELDGAPFGAVEHSIISVGAFATAAMAYDQATADEFGAEAVAVSDHNYFPDSLRGLYLLTLSGRFTACGGS